MEKVHARNQGVHNDYSGDLCRGGSRLFLSDSERCIGGKYFRSGDAFGKCDTAADFSADLYFKCGASGGGLSFYRTRVRRQDGVYVTDTAGFLWVFEQVFPDFVSLNRMR